jgi:hypothetical protein
MKLRLPDFDIELDGLIVHGGVALIATLLGLALPATILFTAYQLLDYLEGEDPREVQGDLVEWMVGLLIGGILGLAVNLG